MGKYGKCSTCHEKKHVSLANDLHGKRRYMCTDCWFWEVKKRARVGSHSPYLHLGRLLP